MVQQQFIITLNQHLPDTGTMLNPRLDIELHRQKFRQSGRVQIPDVLDAAIAARLTHCLDREVPWRLVYLDSGQSVTLGPDQLAQLDETAGNDIMQTVQRGAQSGFQYLFNSYMMVDAYLQKRDLHLPLHTFLEFLNSPGLLDIIKRITGITSIIKADAQATRYLPGHFLKQHNDHARTEGREIAYVLNLTQSWQSDWGGLLQFLDESGQVIDVLAPRHNTLNLFRVPTPHCVSYVAPYARQPRLSITGWFRRGKR